MPDLSFEQVAAALRGAEWKFARTMPGIPHWYTLRDRWRGAVDFEEVVQFIRDHGYDERFGRKIFRRMNSGEWKYWSMGAPLDQTKLINRALLPEWASPTQDQIRALCQNPFAPFEPMPWS